MGQTKSIERVEMPQKLASSLGAPTIEVSSHGMQIRRGPQGAGKQSMQRRAMANYAGRIERHV